MTAGRFANYDKCASCIQARGDSRFETRRDAGLAKADNRERCRNSQNNHSHHSN